MPISAAGSSSGKPRRFHKHTQRPTPPAPQNSDGPRDVVSLSSSGEGGPDSTPRLRAWSNGQPQSGPFLRGGDDDDHFRLHYHTNGNTTSANIKAGEGDNIVDVGSDMTSHGGTQNTNIKFGSGDDTVNLGHSHGKTTVRLNGVRLFSAGDGDGQNTSIVNIKDTGGDLTINSRFPILGETDLNTDHPAFQRLDDSAKRQFLRDPQSLFIPGQ